MKKLNKSEAEKIDTSIHEKINTSDIEGMVEPIWENGIRGWVWDKTRPYQVLSVELTINDEVIADAVADVFDMELANREIGNGKHAFVLRVKQWPDLTLPVVLSVRVSGVSIELGNIKVNTHRDLIGLADTAPIGHIDGVVSGVLKGWAYDQSNPFDPVSVDILDNGEIIGSIECNQFRSDLLALKYANGNCGFSYEMPIALVDGNSHSLSVCFSGSKRALKNGNMLYGLTTENSLTKYIATLIGTNIGLQKEIADIEQRLVSRQEALMAIQRENIESELQVLRKFIIANEDQKSVIPSMTLTSSNSAKEETEKLTRTKRSSKQ